MFVVGLKYGLKCDDNVFIVIENSAFKIGQGEPDNNFLCSAVH